jgi:large subunit ribosomal protein L6
MSRIGKRPVALPAGVSATTEGQILSVKGPKGTLTLQMRDEIRYGISEDGISVQPANQSKEARAFWGMQRTLVQNLVTGVSEGFTKVLEITGVGYRAAAQGKNLRLQLGYSHDVNVPVPDGIEIRTPDATTVEVSGIDRQQVGQVAAEVRAYRSPEPYKGKGVRYVDEVVKLKETKKK